MSIARDDVRCAGLWSLQYFGDEIIVKLSDFAAVRALHFYLAARVVIARHWDRPDDPEIVLAIGAHERIVAWHWELLRGGMNCR